MIYPKTLSVLVYPCTLVSYIRLALLTSALSFHLFWEASGLTILTKIIVVVLLGVSLLLDGVDGYLARRYKHTSYFGTLLDLTIDLWTHTVVWSLSDFYLAMPLVVLEWSAGLYIAAFSRRPADSSWKDTLTKRDSSLLYYYFKNHQRNLLSVYGNFSHFAFPMFLYLQLSQNLVPYLLLPGLILYEFVTLYLLYIFVKILLLEPKE